jgi:DNA-directed RNA polymerase delta subunit
MAKQKKSSTGVRPEVAEALAALAPTEREIRIRELHTAWLNSIGYHAKTKSETRKSLMQARTTFNETITKSIKVGDTKAAVKKLHEVEVAHQDKEEAAASERELNGQAKKAVKAALERMNEAISCTAQMELEYQNKADAIDDAADADDDDDDGDEDDEDEDEEDDEGPRPTVDL